MNINKNKKFIFAFILINLLGCFFVKASCKEEPNIFKEKLVNEITSSKKEFNETYDRCLFLEIPKGYNFVSTNVAVNFILKTALKPIINNIEQLPIYFLRIPVGTGVVDLKIKFDGDKRKDKEVNNFLEKNILDNKISKKLKKYFTKKNIKNTKKTISDLIDKFYSNIELQLKEYKNKLKKFKETKVTDEFLQQLAKKQIEGILLEKYCKELSKDDVEIFYIDGDLLDDDKKTNQLQKFLENKEMLKKIGGKIYDKNKKRYESIIKIYENVLDEKKNKKNKKTKILKEALIILKDVQTRNRLVNFDDKLSEYRCYHYLDIMNSYEEEIKKLKNK